MSSPDHKPALGENRAGRGQRRAFAVLVALASALALAGCGSVRFQSTFDHGGSATHSVTIIIQRDGILPGESPRVEREIDAAVERAAAAGAAVERVDTPGETGLRATTTTARGVDVGAALNNLFNALGAEARDGPVAPFQGTFQRASSAVGGSDFRLDMTFDGAVLGAAVTGAASGLRHPAGPEDLNEVATFEYQATMLGDVIESNGAFVDDSTVRWDLPLDATTRITAYSTVGKKTPWFLTIATIVAALAIIAAIGVAVATVLISRRRTGRLRFGRAPAIDEPATLSGVATGLGRVIRQVVVSGAGRAAARSFRRKGHER